MRLQEKEYKGGFNAKNLFYLSVSWLSKDTFGQARLTRGVTDAWCDKKFKHAGQEFTADAPDLTPQEIESIPGAKASLGRLDEISFEVLERTGGDKMTIKVDEHKYWTSQGGEISEIYGKLREQHLSLIGQQNAAVATPATPATEPTSAAATSTDPDVTLESLAKLEEAHGIDIKTVSEVANVELVLCKDGTVWMVASQDKTVAKHAPLGGFGTGQWVPEADGQPGVPFSVSQGDKTIIQLDESSFSPEAQGISTLTLFKVLVRAEREKGLNQRRFSFLTIERKQDNALEAGQDGFDIKIKNAMKFRCVKDPRASDSTPERISMKNFFSKAIDSMQGSQLIMPVCRFRYERVGQNFKVQRPYVVTKRGISLKKDTPVKISGSTAA